MSIYEAEGHLLASENNPFEEAEAVPFVPHGQGTLPGPGKGHAQSHYHLCHLRVYQSSFKDSDLIQLHSREAPSPSAHRVHLY